VLSVSGALLVVFNTVKSGPHVVRETDQIDETPWDRMSGAWSFHGSRGPEICLIHGSKIGCDDENPVPPRVEESPNNVAEGLTSLGAALEGCD
jgi:hypothetical protein